MAHLLLVEDMPDSLEMLVVTMKSGGHTTVSTTLPEQAVRLFTEEGPFDLVILDVSMPRMNGFAVAEALREIDHNTPIAFLTAFDDPLSAGRASSVQGVVGFWNKPFKASELLAKVEGVLSAT